MSYGYMRGYGYGGYEPPCDDTPCVECDGCHNKLCNDDAIYETPDDGRHLCRDCFAEEFGCEWEETEKVAGENGVTITTADEYHDNLDYCAQEADGYAWAEIRRESY